MSRLTDPELLYNWWQKHCIAHIILCLLISCNYVLLTPHGIFHSEVEPQANFIVGLTLLSTLLGYIGVLSGLPFWITRPFLRLPSSHRWLPSLIVLLSSVFLTFLMIDLAVYYIFRIHFTGIIANMAWSGRFAHFYAWVIFFAIISLSIEGSLYYLIVKHFHKKLWHQFQAFCYFLLGNIFFSTLFYLLAAMNITPNGQVSLRNYQITHNARDFPLYSQFINQITGNKLSLLRLEKMGSLVFDELWQPDHKLQYPLHPLHCLNHPKWNMIFIVIDAWRYDLLNIQNTPNLWHFTQGALEFKHHFSGGNATTPGFFSLFVGLPPNYAEPFQKQKLSPLIFSEFSKHSGRYIFSGPSLKMPDLQSLVFRDFSNVFISPQDDGIAKDQMAINKLLTLLSHPPQDPFAAVLYLGSAHSYCTKNRILTPFLPSGDTCDKGIIIARDPDIIPYLNRYKNTLYTLDNMLKPILQILQHNYPKNTAIVITGDHGEEFNDSKLGYWGHTSAYSKYQTQIPLIIYTPDSHPHKIQRLTTHYDIAPWLLSDICGCQNPAEDYSVGTSILANKSPSFIIQGSYLDLAIRTQQQIIEIYPSGLFDTIDLNYNPLPQNNIDYSILSSAYQQMTRYYQ